MASRAVMFSRTWSALEAPVITVETFGFLAHQASESWLRVMPSSSAMTLRLGALGEGDEPVWRAMGGDDARLVFDAEFVGDDLQLRDLGVALFVGQHVAEPLVPGEGGTAAFRHAVEVFTGQQTRGEWRPDGGAEADVFVETLVLVLDAVTPEQVVLRLLHDGLVEVVLVGDVPRGANLVGAPLRGAPVESLALADHVAHGPHGLFDRRVGVGAVAKDEVDKVETEALERAVDGLAQVLAVQGVLHVRDVVQTPEELGGHDVLVTLPAELAEGFAHDALRLTGGVALGVVEEVDTGVFGGAEALSRFSGLGDLVLVGKGHPGPEGEHADLQAGPTEATIFHFH